MGSGRGEVYLGGERLAELEVSGGSGDLSVTWKHADPARGSFAESFAGGSAARRELDPLGQEVGTENPHTLYGGSYGQMAGGDLLYGEGGNPFDAGHGCSLDGISVPCSLAMERLNHGTAVFDTITTVTIRRGGRVESYSGRAWLPAGYGARFTGSAARVAASAWREYEGGRFGAAVFMSILWGRLAGGSGTDARGGAAASFFAPQHPAAFDRELLRKNIPTRRCCGRRTPARS